MSGMDYTIAPPKARFLEQRGRFARAPNGDLASVVPGDMLGSIERWIAEVRRGEVDFVTSGG